MTTEEKAKAYDEALDRCKEWVSGTWGHSVDDSPKDIAEFIFPELAESEDERIRKSVIGFLKTIASLKDGKTVSNEDFDSEALLEWASYLEKQKELPFVKDVVLGYPGIYFYDGERMHFQGNPAMEEKQKEPLPIPDKFSGLKSLMLQYLQSAANRKDDTEIEDDTDLYGRKILDYVWKYDGTQKEQKPAEPRNWPADKDNLTQEQKFTHHETNESLKAAVTHQMEDDGDVDDFVRKGIDEIALKYAKLGAKWQKEQKPVEWSEEDKQMMDYFERLLEYAYNNDPHNLGKCCVAGKMWLKSLRPQSQWKPNNEQMKALHAASSLSSLGEYVQRHLWSLYEQLKKLGVKEEPEYYQHFDPDC